MTSTTVARSWSAPSFGLPPNEQDGCQLERCWRGFLGWRILTTHLSSPSSISWRIVSERDPTSWEKIEAWFPMPPNSGTEVDGAFDELRNATEQKSVSRSTM